MAHFKHQYQRRIFSHLGSNRVLIHPGLREVTGSINGMVWLSQILYWYDKGDNPGEIRKSRSELTRETGLSRDQQIRVESSLKLLGIVKISVKPGRPSPVNHISLDFNRLEKLCLDVRGLSTLRNGNGPDRSTHMPENISESTHENTQRIVNGPRAGPGYLKAKQVAEKIKSKKG